MFNAEMTDADYEVIFAALESHEKAAASTQLSSMLLGVMLCPPDKRDDFTKSEERKMRESDAANRVLKDRVAIVRAKLISIRDAETADKLTRTTV